VKKQIVGGRLSAVFSFMPMSVQRRAQPLSSFETKAKFWHHESDSRLKQEVFMHDTLTDDSVL
jgi:hypothetical protein